mmetsp:Transcript_8292/g.12569  ORF Transcript_8292/g.12569 Transcript_8292/m.12569 type:complete len:118 (+) Transcript_8292:318-671(+)
MAPVTSAPSKAPFKKAPVTSSAPTKEPVTATPTKTPSKAPVASAPTKAPIHCCSYTGRRGKNYKAVTTGCSWDKKKKTCSPNSASAPEGCNSHTRADEGPQACTAVSGCAWFASQCM